MALIRLTFQTYNVWRDGSIYTSHLALLCSILLDYIFRQRFELVVARGMPLSPPLQQQECSANVIRHRDDSHTRKKNNRDEVTVMTVRWIF